MLVLQSQHTILCKIQSFYIFNSMLTPEVIEV
jgi:hypothetical protein